MTHLGSDVCEMQLTEEMNLLLLDFDTDVMEGRAGRGDATCSRNVMRKQRNWEKQLATKKSKRKEEKQRRKLNRAQMPATNSLNPQYPKGLMRETARERLAEAQSRGPKLCVDLSMTDCMSDKEISRLASQLRRLYGSNRKAARPFHLFLTNMSQTSRLYKECLRMNDGFLNYVMERREEPCQALFPPEALVYLSPDAEEELKTVDADKVYVLGGLVDESIQKRLSFSRAKELSIHMARLPIDEYMVKKENRKNFHSKVLAINQVFDILLTFFSTGSWAEALQAWFPKNKGYIVSSAVCAAPPSPEADATGRSLK